MPEDHQPEPAPDHGAPKFNRLVLEAVAEERDTFGEKPEWTFEAWGNAFASVLGQYAQSAGVIGAAGRRLDAVAAALLKERRGYGEGEEDAVEALKGQAQAEGMNARLFVIRLMAMGFDWLEQHEAEKVKLS